MTHKYCLARCSIQGGGGEYNLKWEVEISRCHNFFVLISEQLQDCQLKFEDTICRESLREVSFSKRGNFHRLWSAGETLPDWSPSHPRG